MRTVTSVLNRGWSDGNHNFVVDCDLLNPAAQNNLATGGDSCAAATGNSLNFGNINPNLTTVNPAILQGWGVRPYDWQFGASVQQELLPRVSLEVSYNRRWFGNFFVTDNLTHDRVRLRPVDAARCRRIRTCPAPEARSPITTSTRSPPRGARGTTRRSRPTTRRRARSTGTA